MAFCYIRKCNACIRYLYLCIRLPFEFMVSVGCTNKRIEVILCTRSLSLPHFLATILYFAIRPCVCAYVHLYVICNTCNVWYIPLRWVPQLARFIRIYCSRFILASIIWFIISSILQFTCWVSHYISGGLLFVFVFVWCIYALNIYETISVNTMWNNANCCESLYIKTTIQQQENKHDRECQAYSPTERYAYILYRQFGISKQASNKTAFVQQLLIECCFWQGGISCWQQNRHTYTQTMCLFVCLFVCVCVCVWCECVWCACVWCARARSFVNQ